METQASPANSGTGVFMHVHNVYFWLWKTVSPSQRAEFEHGLDMLTRDPNVMERQIGVPAHTKRPVIDSSYDYGVVLKFKSTAAHDAYQAGEAHQLFLDSCSRLWSRVQVYDIESR